MGAQESAARNKNDGIEIGEEFDKSSGLYKVWSHVNSCTKNKKTKGTIFTRKWDCPAETRKYIENGVKLLKKLHHPGVVTFLDCQESPGQLSLMTERVQVLDLCISSLSFVEVHSGLCQILEVLLFLHEKAKIGHNNICPCSIFVTSNGEWKMGGFELAQPVETASTDFLKSQFYKTTKCARFSPPDEMSSKQTGLERDAYAFGRLIDYVLCHLPPDEIIDEELSLSLRDISEKMTNVETLEDLSCLTESYAFSNELTAITNFLNRIQIKSQDEKEAFYKGIEQRLRALPADVVARRLCRLVVSRYVILEPLSHEYLYPSLLTPQDSKTPGILPLDLYKTHLLPEIVRVFAVKETSVRLGLLTHFTRYASHIPPNILECFVVDEVVRGSRDVDDRLVAASLRAMADLVIILGAERVCDWKLTKCFMDGTASKKSSTTKLSNGSAVTGRKTEHKAKTAKPVVKVEKVKERVVPPPSIPRETTPPPREEQTQEDQTVWEDADDWSEDWNTTAGQEEKVEMKEEVKPVTPPSPVVLPSTKTTTKKENGIGSTFEIKASKGLEDDFFADMAPEIKTGGTIIDKLIALQKEKETTPSVPADLSSKFAMSADDVEEDTNWGGWEEEEAVEPPREKSLEAAIPNESDPVEGVGDEDACGSNSRLIRCSGSRCRLTASSTNCLDLSLSRIM